MTNIWIIIKYFFLVNPNTRVLEIEQQSVKKYIKGRQTRIKSSKPSQNFSEPNENILPKVKDTKIRPSFNIKQRLRTEVFGTRAFTKNEEENSSWQRNLTVLEKKELLNSLSQNYEKFKRAASAKTTEKYRNFLNKKQLDSNKLPISDQEKNFKGVFKKGEDRIKKVFENQFSFQTERLPIQAKPKKNQVNNKNFLNFSTFKKNFSFPKKKKSL